MRAGTGSGSLAERFSLPALRSRIPLRCARWCQQGLSVHQLPASSFAGYRNGIAAHQIAIDDLVSGDLPDQPSQAKTGLSTLALKRHLGVCYPTAWLIQPKLMQGQARQKQPPSGVMLARQKQPQSGVTLIIVLSIVLYQ